MKGAPREVYDGFTDRKNIRICMKQHLHTERKNSKYKKRDSPLSPGMWESVNYYQNILDTDPTMGMERFFYIKIAKKTSEKRDPTNPFAVHLVNPFSILGNQRQLESCSSCLTLHHLMSLSWEFGSLQ